MSTPFIGEVRLFAGNFAPRDWAFCDGSLMPIAGNEALFSLIGTTYGGDGQSTFALPDLRGRVPLHQTSGYTIGQRGGSEAVTLTSGQMAQHTHALVATNTAANAGSGPSGSLLAASSVATYGSAAGPSLDPAATSSYGASLPHENMAPFVALNYIVCLFGVYPSRA